MAVPEEVEIAVCAMVGSLRICSEWYNPAAAVNTIIARVIQDSPVGTAIMQQESDSEALLLRWST